MITMKFEGGRELEQALAELGKRTIQKRTAERALMKAAEPVRDRWKQLAPVQEGVLRESIKIGRANQAEAVFKKDFKGDTAYAIVAIDWKLDPRLYIYSQVQEFGNESNPAQPAGRPAFEAEKENALARLGDDLWSEIEKTAQRQARKAARLAARAN